MKVFGNKYIQLVLAVALLSGCKSYRLDQEGRVYNENYTYYTNDDKQLGVQLFGDMSEAKSDTTWGTRLSQWYPRDVDILKKLKVFRKDTILFTSRTGLKPYYNVLGLIRSAKTISLNDYESVSVSDTVRYYFREYASEEGEIAEALIPWKQHFVSLVYYAFPPNDHCKYCDLKQLAKINAERIYTGKSLYQPEDPFTVANELFKKHGYLTPLLFIKNNEKNYQLDNEKNLFYQAAATYYSFSHQTRNANDSWRKLQQLYSSEEGRADTILTGSFIPAKDEILKEAARNQIVMFNESHHHPEHRYFVGELLPDLYKLGFRYLALEAFMKPDSLKIRQFPTSNNGFYLRDPVFANLVRHAISIGYTVVDYESADSDRESGQAKNLYERTLGKDKEAKVVVLAGYAHIEEEPVQNRRWMANIFKELSGINPLTINQTKTTTKTAVVPDSIKGEQVYLIENDSLGEGNDLYVWNNISLKGTNNCFAQDKSQEMSITVPEEKLLPKAPHALLIYKKNELEQVRDEALPVFVELLDTGKTTVKADLCKGEYVVQCKTLFKEIRWQKELHVK